MYDQAVAWRKKWVNLGKVRIVYTTCQVNDRAQDMMRLNASVLTMDTYAPMLQVMSTIPSTVDITLPEPARSFFSILDLSGLNPLELVAGECVNEELGSYDMRVAASTLGVIALCALNW